MDGFRTTGPIAYLTGEYPKASHTFILREIAALRAVGVTVQPASIRRGTPGDLIGQQEKDAQAETFYVLETARRPAALIAAQFFCLLRRPSRYFEALLLAVRSGRPGAKGLIWQLFYFAEATVLAKHMMRGNAVHLHNHFADSSANVAMLAATLAGIPFSFTLHGPAELFEPESWHLGKKVARSAFTVCISHFARSQAMLFSDPDHWDKLKIVHCGVFPDRYTSGVPAAASDETRLLFVGRITAIKGLRVLFSAIEGLRKTRPDLHLSIIGDGPDRAWAEDEARRIGGITLLGYRSQDEVSEALGHADILVLPSFAEGVPVVLMEAMASGRPVIATSVGGVSELVEDGVSGRLVAPGDAVALAAAIETLADDPEARATMGAAGRAKVEAEFDVACEAGLLATLFQGETGGGPRPQPAEDA
ncbi:MAG: glycosyltransferase [Pseudomonadota bacterium]